MDCACPGAAGAARFPLPRKKCYNQFSRSGLVRRMSESTIESAGAERRRAPRLRVRTVITAQVAKAGLGSIFAKPINAMVVNVSPKGVGFHAKVEPPAVGSKVVVEILALGHTRKFKGSIAHISVIQSGYIFGVELKTEREESLIAYLKSCEAEFEIR